MRTVRTMLLAGLAAGLLAAPAAAQSAFTADMLDRLTFRSIGPAVTGGRIHDVEAHPSDPSTVLLGSASGGIWKSTNKGTSWQPVFENQPVSTFGDIAIAPSDPRIVWAGTGEQNNRQSTSWGNGVYRSTDGGETWTHVGLDGTHHIGRVRVHPSNPDIAWVAALGNLWRPTPDRGVFRTTDAGRTWEKVLYVDTLTGVVDLALDPGNPDILYAAAYQRLRRTWGFNGGGPGSGILRSTDGGTTWTRLTNGLPSGDLGRIGIALAESDPRILYATVEHADSGGVYRTADGGETWSRVSSLNQRPMYYSHLFVDPTNPDRVYKLATGFYRSDDGGRNFRRMPTAPTYDVGVHADFHSLWIDPTDTRHFFLAGDGGLYESWDMGESYMRLNNVPISQIYGIGVDDRDPYYVYLGLQDNHSWLGPSATRHWTGIIGDDWRQIGFGDGMYHQVDPTNHRYVYSNAQNGSWTRVDAETGDVLRIEPPEPEGEEYRWDWVSPSLISRHEPATIYVGGNRLFISRDRGLSWERTEDLTKRIDRDTLSLMGVRGSERMLSRNDGTSSFGEIVTIAESPLDAAVLWVGVDDGNLQVSRDGGRTWAEVSRNVPDLPRNTYVSRVLASAAGRGEAYATFDAHRDGDWRPYVYRTDDFGETWTPRTNGLPEDGSVNVIAEDPDNPSVLYLGTEHALFASGDAGRTWTRFTANLPTTLYDDIVIHPRTADLILATHGRGVFILDDARPLAEWSADIAGAPLHVFSVRPATAFHYWKDTSYRGNGEWNGTNPPHGAIITYHVGRPAAEAVMVVTNPSGDEVRRLEVDGSAGLHRVVWDLRWEPPPAGGFGGGDDDEEEPDLPQPVGRRGPFAAPGTYTVTLEAGGQRASRTIEVRADPMLELTVGQHVEREQFLVGVLRLQHRTAPLVQRANQLRRTLQQQVEAAGQGVTAELRGRAEAVAEAASSLGSAARTLNGIASAYNGSGVRPGSMYGPTETHREEVAEATSAIEEAERVLAANGG